MFDALFSDHVSDAVVIGFGDFRADANGEISEDRFNLLTPVRINKTPKKKRHLQNFETICHNDN